MPNGAYPPVPGYPPTPGAPLPPPPNRNNVPRILAIVGIVVVVVAAVGIYSFLTRDTDSGTSVETSPVASCITVSGSSTNITTASIDCDDTSKVSYIVSAKLDASSKCEAGGYEYYVYEYGTGASKNVSCLIPNYRVGSCYEESSIAIGLDLKSIACTESSSNVTVRYRITERTDSRNVPNRTDTETQKVFAYDIASGAKTVGFCAEIVGDGYTWK